VAEYRQLEDMVAVQNHDASHSFRACALNQCCQLAGRV
jgi:hypothetical protein